MKDEGDFSKEEMRQRNAAMSIERYTHHYERYHAHDRSRLAAIADLEAARTTGLAEISALIKTPESQLRFVLQVRTTSLPSSS